MSLPSKRPSRGSIVNPATGASSRSFVLAGKVDGVVRIGDEHFLLEHKTASQVDADYLERLWTDFQIVLYSRYVEQTLGIRIAGVLYNILVKARLQQGRGETEAEFEARRADLIAKSKTGKSSAKRRLPESDDEFQARLAAKYTEPGMFHREMLYLSRDRFETLQSELWELTQAFSRRAPTRRLLPEHGLLFSLPPVLRLFPGSAAPTAAPTSSRTFTAKSPRTKSCGTRPRSKRLRLFEDPIEKENRHVAYEEKSPKARSRRSHGAGLRPEQDRQIDLVFPVRRRAVSRHRTGAEFAGCLSAPHKELEELLAACGEIAEGKHPYKTIILDTVDNVYRMCSDYICTKFKIEHESDLGYGKGWALINNEFQRV